MEDLEKLSDVQEQIQTLIEESGLLEIFKTLADNDILRDMCLRFDVNSCSLSIFGLSSDVEEEKKETYH